MAKKTSRAATERASVLGMPVDKVDMLGALHRVEGYLQGGAHQVVTANAEIFQVALADDELRRIVRGADLVLADGAGLVWASEFLGDPVPERVAGIDFVTSLMELCARSGHKVYFLGAAPGIAEKAAEALKAWFPTLSVAGAHHGYFRGDEEDGVIAGVRESGASVLLVALGAPRAEKWIYANKTKLAVPVMVGVGGSLDVFAGVASRAPRWMQRARLEWAYRLLRQPSRAGRMVALPRFVVAVVRWRMASDKRREGAAE